MYYFPESRPYYPPRHPLYQSTRGLTQDSHSLHMEFERVCQWPSGAAAGSNLKAVEQADRRDSLLWRQVDNLASSSP